MLAFAGSKLSRVSMHAAGASGTLWLCLAGLSLVGAPVRPAGLLAVAAVALTCLLLALLASGARLGAAASASPRATRAALRQKAWRAAFLPQLDPDAPGRARPRAPSACPAAA
ncbi:MAG: DUF6412 domain-containing protein [Gemmatimonadota bacterium]